MGYPVLWVGGPAAPPRSASDVEIVNWCGQNGVVWVTFDRGLTKDREIYDAVMAAGASVFLVPAKGLTIRGYLLLLILGFERESWEGQVAEAAEPLRRRVGPTGRLRRAKLTRPKA